MLGYRVFHALSHRRTFSRALTDYDTRNSMYGLGLAECWPTTVKSQTEIGSVVDELSRRVARRRGMKV